MFALLVLLLASPALAATDGYKPLKPLMGVWLVDRDCKVFHDKVLVEFSRLEKTVLVEFKSPKDPSKVWGKADVVYDGQEDHYRVFTSVPDHPVTKNLGIQNIQGSLSVSDDPDNPEGPGHDYLTSSSSFSALTAQLAVKLRNNFKKATFTFKMNSPMGGMSCKGTGAKQPKPAAPAAPAVPKNSAIND